MGDLQTDQGEALELRFVPVSEVQRLLNARASRGERAHAGPARRRRGQQPLELGDGHEPEFERFSLVCL